MGGEDYGGLVVGGADGEDVPGVGGDDEGGEEVELVGAVDDVAGANGADPFGRYRSLRAGPGVVALVDGAFDPFVAVAPQGRLWTRRKRPRWPRSSLSLPQGRLWRRRRGRFLPRGLLQRNPRSVAYCMKRSSAHSPRSLGCAMCWPWGIAFLPLSVRLW